MSYSITQIITKNKDNLKAVISERPYDCLYDPVYTVSSEVDHTRANFKAYAPRGRFGTRQQHNISPSKSHFCEIKLST
ncbi:hypothetical protein CHARACLAT_028312 [Characodon lateralis]|uniref:Uncharacterized protein n=1 Tax=Characodon lateralis TaxID=208331 RepID=A0ABU7DV16_9TELE|nr:hypothetical protein [Characodon lateralis]